MEILGGPLYAVAGAGESHGPAVTTIVMGCPPGHYIRREAIQAFLDRRRPGGNKHGTPRNEKDKVVLLSGLYQEDHDRLISDSQLTLQSDGVTYDTHGYEEGYTTGEPIAAMVLSTSRKSGDYRQFSGPQGEVRPGHTDLVKFHQSGGFVDVRGGGRSSYRSTISDVIGGSIARIMLRELFSTVILSSITQVGPLRAKLSLAEHVEAMVAENHSVHFPLDVIDGWNTRLHEGELHAFDQDFSSEAARLIMATRKQGDSLGALLEVVAVNVPPLLGDPLYQSLKLRLMGALGGLNAVQSCEVGAGMEVIDKQGSVNNDPIRAHGYVRNSHGGLIGGITTGMPLVMRVGFKPTSTIHKPQQSIRKNLEEIDFRLDQGRHDPCVGVRAGVTLESRVGIELLNAALWHQSRQLHPGLSKLF